MFYTSSNEINSPHHQSAHSVSTKLEAKIDIFFQEVEIRCLDIHLKEREYINRMDHRSHIKSGSGWIILDNEGQPIILDINPDFEIIEEIHSHRADIFAILSALVFISEYCKFNILEYLYKITLYGDNMEVITKFKNLTKEPQFYNEYFNTTDYDVCGLLLW